MRRFFVIFIAGLSLGACGVVDSVSSPSSNPIAVCNRTAADEQGVVAFNLGYKAFRLAAETGVRSGFITGLVATKVRAINDQLFGAVQNVDTVYKTCSGDLAAALAGANRLLSQGNSDLEAVTRER